MERSLSVASIVPEASIPAPARGREATYQAIRATTITAATMNTGALFRRFFGTGAPPLGGAAAGPLGVFSGVLRAGASATFTERRAAATARAGGHVQESSLRARRLAAFPLETLFTRYCLTKQALQAYAFLDRCKSSTDDSDAPNAVRRRARTGALRSTLRRRRPVTQMENKDVSHARTSLLSIHSKMLPRPIPRRTNRITFINTILKYRLSAAAET